MRRFVEWFDEKKRLVDDYSWFHSLDSFGPGVPEAIPYLQELAGRPGPYRRLAVVALARFPQIDISGYISAVLTEEATLSEREELRRLLWRAGAYSEDFAVKALLENPDWTYQHTEAAELAEALRGKDASPSWRLRLLKELPNAGEKSFDSISSAAYSKGGDIRQWVSELKEGPIDSWSLAQLVEQAPFCKQVDWSLVSQGRAAGVAGAILEDPATSARILRSGDEKAIVYLIELSRLMDRPLPTEELSMLAKESPSYREIILRYLQYRDEANFRHLYDELGGPYFDWELPLLREADAAAGIVALHGWAGGDEEIVLRQTAQGDFLNWERKGRSGRRQLSATESADFRRWFGTNYSENARNIVMPSSHSWIYHVLLCWGTDRRRMRAVNPQLCGMSGVFLRDLIGRLETLVSDDSAVKPP